MWSLILLIIVTLILEGMVTAWTIAVATGKRKTAAGLSFWIEIASGLPLLMMFAAPTLVGKIIILLTCAGTKALSNYITTGILDKWQKKNQ